MKYLFILVALLGILPARAAEIDPDLDREIRLMLDLTGSSELGVTVMKNMVTEFRKALPNVPDSFWTDFEGEVHARDLTELVVPIYARHLTIDEVKAANRFYSTPEGKAMVAKLPVIMGESMRAGQVWGEAIAQKVLNRLKDADYLPKDA